MSFEKNLRRFSRALLPVSPPADLRNRVFNALPTAQPVSPVGRYLTIGIVLVVCAGIFFLPRLLVKPSFAQEMRSAIEQAQTWHFVGWRLTDGKQVRWEIWGRRSPYFYREQIGDDIQIEDSTQRIRIIPPDPHPWIARKTGLAVRMAPEPLPTKEEPDATNHLLPFARGIGGEYWQDRWFSEQSRTPEGRVTLRSSIRSTGSMDMFTLLIANAKTKLPVRIELHNTVYKPGYGDQYPNRPVERQIEEAVLEAEYNVPLPVDVAAYTIPQGYHFIDFTRGPVEGQHPDGSATKNSLTLKAEPIAQDAVGNLRLQFRAILGDEPFDAKNLPFSLNIVHEQFDGLPIEIKRQGMKLVTTRKHFATDNQGNHYVMINRPWVVTYPDAPDMYLVPIEPFAVNAPRPTQLRLQVDASVLLYKMGANNQISSVPITQEKMELLVTLPRKIAPSGLGYDTATDPRVIPPKIRHTLALQSAWMRSSYYAGWRKLVRNGEPPDAEIIHEQEQAIYWYEVTAREAARIGLTKEATDFRGYAEKQRRELEAYRKARQ